MAQISLHSLIIAFPVCTHAENEGCSFEAHMMIKKGKQVHKKQALLPFIRTASAKT